MGGKTRHSNLATRSSTVLTQPQSVISYQGNSDFKRCRSKKKSQDKSSTASGQGELHRLQYRERQHSLPRYSGGQILPITSSVLDYEEVTIPEDSVIYCDIPYEGTDGYLEKGQGGFDYERFYQWCERQTQPVFISSYQMPEDRFGCIEEFTHRSTFAQKYNNLVTERIYVPKHQAERGNRIVQLTLF